MATMNLDVAQTEAFVRFVEFENRFDEEFKIADAAMNFVGRVVSGPGGPSIMKGLMKDGGDFFREKDFWDAPAAKLAGARLSAALLGIVQIHSAIDDFLVNVEADLQRWKDAQSGGTETLGPMAQPLPAEEVDEDDGSQDGNVERIERTCIRLGWQSPDFHVWRPLLLLFRGIRNCVAHRSGAVTTRVAELSRSSAVKDAMNEWPKRKGKTGPAELPKLQVDQPVVLAARHIIFCLELAHRVLAYMNERCVHELGPNGLAFLCAHHSVLNGRPGSTRAFIGPERIINEVLEQRHHVTLLDPQETISLLKDAGIWKKTLAHHQHLYGDRIKSRQSKKAEVKARRAR